MQKQMLILISLLLRNIPWHGTRDMGYALLKISMKEETKFETILNIA